MTDVNIKQVEGGQVTSLNDTDAFEIDTGSTSVWIAKSDLFLLASTFIRNANDYKIAPSVASNNLTVDIQHYDGSAVSSTSPLKFRVGATEFTMTSALSFTKNAGTNWCNLGSAELAAQNADLFVYAIGETGASAGLKFGFSRIPYARTMSDFVNTSTNEKYIAGGWTNFNATDAVLNIGRFRAQLSAAASYNWSIPSALVINLPVFESDPLSFTPTHSRTGTAYTNLPTVNNAIYKIAYDRLLVFERHTQNATPGGTGDQQLTMPFTNPYAAGQPVLGSNNTGNVVNWAAWVASSTQVLLKKYDGTTDVTASNAYAISASLLLR